MKKDMKKDMKKNINLFYGMEDFLIDEEIKRMRLAKKLDQNDTGYQVFQGSGIDYNAVIQALQAVSLFAAEKFLVVDWPAFLKIVPENEQQQELLLNALEDCPDTITVVFKAGEKVDFRKKLPKWLKAQAKVREFKGFKPWEKEKLKSWVLNKIILSKKKIESPALDLLVETTGINCRLLEQEIKKLIIYKGQEPKITLEDIKALASSGQLDSFELINMLRKKNTKGALVLIEKLKKEEDPIGLLGLIVSQFRLFLQILQAKQSGMDLQQLSKLLGKNPYYLKQINLDLNQYSLKKLKELYLQLQELDLGIKSGQKELWLALEEFILSI
ncbi:DNA polymerase III subunit delta [Candidatus Margulisiibacteriota bacterium]